jgi:putative ABC transport system permease protein
VVAFAVAAVALVTLVCGSVPALMAVGQLHDAVRVAPRTLTGTRREGRVRRAFVVVQIGGATALLVCMSLVARGFARLERVPPGFTSDHALSVQLSLPPMRYGTRAAVLQLYDALRPRVAALPGVHAVGVVSLLPLSGLLNTIDIGFPDRPAPPPDQVPQAHFRIASAGYFAAAGIHVLDGREFTEGDYIQTAPVAVVSRTLAERHWPGERAVGKYMRLMQGSSPAALQIVGVVDDVKQFTVDGTATADLYVPLKQMPTSQTATLVARMYWVARTDVDPRQLVDELRQAVRKLDPDIAASSVRTLDDILAASLSGRRASMWLLQLFGQLAIALGALGVYSIAAFAAGARMRELAIRSAFGARGRELVALVVAAEYPAVCLGIVGGLVVARFAAASLGPMLFSVSASDPFTYVTVAATLLAVTLAAAWLPAVRAGRVDPAELLRS